MKKIICLVISLMLVFTMAGCGQGSEGQTDPGESGVQLEPHTIAVLVYDRSDDEVQAFRNYLQDYLGSIFNVKFIYSESVLTEDAALEFIDEACEYGAEGVMSFVSYDLKSEVSECEKKGIYYMLASGTVSDEDFDKVKESEAFLGVVGPGKDTEYEAGADMAAHFIKDDGTKAFFIFSGGGCMGNEMHLKRTEGILDKIQQEYGVTFSMSSEEAAVSSEPVELSAGDVSVCVCPGYFSIEEYLESAIETYKDHPYGTVLSVLPVNKLLDTIKGGRLGLIDCYSETNLQLFTDGTLEYVSGKYSSIVGPSFAAMYNAITGYRDELRMDGEPFRITQGFWNSDSEKDYNDKYVLASSIEINAYNYEDLQKVMKVFNEDTTIEELKALAEACSYEDALNRRF